MTHPGSYGYMGVPVISKYYAIQREWFVDGGDRLPPGAAYLNGWPFCRMITTKKEQFVSMIRRMDRGLLLSPFR